MQWILYAFIFVICFFACFVVYKVRQKMKWDILEAGTFLILTSTLIILAIYAFDTNRLARLTQKRWDRESILLASYAIAVTDHKGEKGRTGFAILNPSNLMLQAKVWCNLKVYGVPVTPDDAFNGKRVWTILPSQPYQGWFEIESLLKQSGRTVEKMINEYSEVSRDKQLTMDLKIEFRNELGDSRILPSMKYYFVFDEWKWIPEFTDKPDWSF